MKQVLYTMYDKRAEQWSPVEGGVNIATVLRQLGAQFEKMPERDLKDFKIKVFAKINTNDEEFNLDTIDEEYELVDIVKRRTDDQDIAMEG